MGTLPQLTEDDIRALTSALQEFLFKSEASIALVIDKGGFLITECGPEASLDTTTLAALSAGSFAATACIANLVSETNFSSVYQQGENNSLLVVDVDECCLLASVFPAQISVGAVKYFAAGAIQQIARQLKKAHRRNPKAGLDLSLLNVANTQDVFSKKVA